MKKFIKKILSFSIIFFLGSISLIFISNLIKYKFIYVYNSQSNNLEKIDEIEVGFFGDSHLKGSIDTYKFEKIINKKTFSFSKGGRPLYFSSALAERILKLNSKMDVIIDLGSNNLPFVGLFTYLEDDLFHDTAFQDYLSLNIYLLNLDDIKKFMSINFFKTIQSYFKGLFDTSFFLFDGLDYNESDYLININQDISITKKEIKTYSKANHILNYDFELNKLLSVIERFPNTNFIVIRPPETHEAKLIYPQYYFDIFKNELIKYKNVTFKDFSDENMNYKKDFNDLTHLSKIGMDNFTDTFVDYYKNLD